MDTAPVISTAVIISGLIKRLKEVDPDFRFMALNDLIELLTGPRSDCLLHDYNTASRTVEAVVKALDDGHGEVQNQAVKCMGPVAARIPISLVSKLMDKLTTLKLTQAQDKSLPSLALRNAIVHIPVPKGVAKASEPAKIFAPAITGVSQFVVARLIEPTLRPKKDFSYQTDNLYLLDNVNEIPEQMDVLIEVLRSMGEWLTIMEVEGLLQTLMMILTNVRASSGVRKRVVTAISMLAEYAADSQLASLMDRIKEKLRTPNQNPLITRLFITMAGQMARTSPKRIGPNIKTLAPLILEVLDQKHLDAHMEAISQGEEGSKEFDDLSDAAISTLDAFLESCSEEMKLYTEEVIEIGLRFSKYDPNSIPDDDDDDDVMEDDEATEDDDDSEFDDFGDDDNDTSWRLRRGAIRELYSLISTRGSKDLLNAGVLYRRITPVLIKRFSDSDENVQLEAISTVALTIQKTGEYLYPSGQLDEAEIEAGQIPVSRKRRRQSSNLGTPTAPITELLASKIVKADLTKLAPVIVKAAAKVMNSKIVSVNQAVITLMDDLVKVKRGGLEGYFEPIVLGVIKCLEMKASNMTLTMKAASGTFSATQTTLKTSALTLIRDICKYEPAILKRHQKVMSRVLIETINEALYKISSDAILTAEEVAKAFMVPNFAAGADLDFATLYNIIYELAKSSANKVDNEVRQRAVHALGVIISMTLGLGNSSPISVERREAGLLAIFHRLDVDVTRLQAVQALDAIAICDATAISRLGPGFLKEIVSKLAAIVSSGSRQHANVAIQALKHFISPQTGAVLLPTGVLPDVVERLLPAVKSDDTFLMTSGLWILNSLAELEPKLVATDNVAAAVAYSVGTKSADIALEPLLEFVTVLGKSGLSAPLMSKLLVSTDNLIHVNIGGRVIGTLIVAGGDSTGVTLDAFVRELGTLKEDTRTCMVLAVLGEAGRQLGPRSPLKPQVFINQFGDGLSRVSMMAAASLGRAASGNVAAHMPVFLTGNEQAPAVEYMLIHALKEMMEAEPPQLVPYFQAIWDYLLTTVKLTAENRIVIAECLAKLTVADPVMFVPKLQLLFNDESKASRALANHCLRYSLPNKSPVYENAIKSTLISMLLSGLQDAALENRRLGMTNLTTATQYKASIVLPRLGDLMPHIIFETVIKPELIREIMMGPFKHIIDNGLDLRKGAYETLYALLKLAVACLDIKIIYARIIAGLDDDLDIFCLCNLMVLKLSITHNEETIRQLDAIAVIFKKILTVELKEGAVKQEVERQGEASRGVLQISLVLADRMKLLPGQAVGWQEYWAWVLKNMQAQLKAAQIAHARPEDDGDEGDYAAKEKAKEKEKKAKKEEKEEKKE